MLLSPLRFSFDANELRLPVRLGLLNAAGKQDLIVYVLHPTSRFEVANYTNTFIPTNLEVADEVRNNFGAFYAELFDATVEKMGRKAVVTEYAWQTTGCDPCPTPPLSPTTWRRWAGRARGHRRRGPAADAEPSKPSVTRASAAATPAPFFGGGASWVLTRLHTRYEQGDALRGPGVPRGEAGDRRARQLGRHQRRRGRAGRCATAASTTSRAATSSATTGRGRSRARSPRYDIWGGPPGNPYGGPPPTAAKGLATAPRGKVALTTEVRSPVPLLGIAGTPPPRRKPAP